MPKHRRNRQPRHFIVLTANAERGNALDQDGHATDPVVRLVIRGRWTHGHDQEISLLIPGDAVAPLGELLLKAAPPPPDPAPDQPATPVAP